MALMLSTTSGRPETLLHLTPLWTSSIFLSISIGIQGSLIVLQALTMDRSLRPHFSVPVGSVIVFLLITVAIVLPLIDCLPILIHKTLTPLRRVSLGHVLNAVGMTVSALVERQRSSIVHAHNASDDAGWTVPIPVLWLVLPMATTGLSEAMHFPALSGVLLSGVSDFYEEHSNKGDGVFDSDRVLREHIGGLSCTEGHELVAG